MAVATARLAIGQTLLVGTGLVVCLLLPPTWKYITGALLIALSMAYSYRYLSKESTIILKIRNKLRR